jgi:TusA-related sulfurtransferase
MVTVDARGLSCPQPVILARKAILDGEFPIEVLVETVTSRENVRRASEKLGCQVAVEDVGGEFKLILTK